MEVEEENDNHPMRGGRSIPPQLQEHYEKKLINLQQNETKHFTISECADEGDPLLEELDESDFTIEQWNILFNELKKNKSVEIVTVELRCCPIECLTLFVDFIRTSPTLRDVIIQYMSFIELYEDEELELPSEIPENYRTAIDDILQAVRQNPSIQNLHLHCLGNPQSMEHLLVGNDSIKKFELSMYKYDDTSTAMAKSIAAGFKGNNALREISLSVDQDIDFATTTTATSRGDDDNWTGDDNIMYEDRGRLDIIISGLCHHADDDSSSKNLESLSLHHRHPETNPELAARVLEVIRCTPSLKTLVLAGDDHEAWLGDEAWSVSVLKNLSGPEYVGLKNLKLRGVRLGTSNRDFEKDKILAGSNRILPDDQVNKTLEKLDLANVLFHHQNVMGLLWHLRGLRQLNIVDAVMNSRQWIENENNSNAPEYWAECFRCCAQLCQVDIDLGNFIRRREVDVGVDVSDMCTNILNGARGHNSHQQLKLRVGSRTTLVPIGSNDVGVLIPEGRLRLLLQQLLRETSCLKDLSIMNIGPQVDLASGLAQGLRENKSLEKLDLNMKHMEASNFITVIESLFENQMLKNVDHDSTYRWGDNIVYDSHTSHEICKILRRLFRLNASLYHIRFPRLDLRGQNMHVLLEGLCDDNTTLKSLDMVYCQTDDAGLRLLGQALATTVQLEHIVLPRHGSFTNAGFKDFLGSIAQMRHVKTLDLGGCFNNLRGGIYYFKECLKLLLNATQKNKYIISLGQSLPQYHHVGPLLSEMEYNLQLNRCGRHILDKFINQSLWPTILVGVMASNTTPEEEQQHANVLFFVIRQYFMKNSYPLRRRPQQQQNGRHVPPPPSKRARVVHGDESG